MNMSRACRNDGLTWNELLMMLEINNGLVSGIMSQYKTVVLVVIIIPLAPVETANRSHTKHSLCRQPAKQQNTKRCPVKL